MATPNASKLLLTDRLVALAQDCDACERSWSITNDGAEERFLFFFDHQPGRALALAEAAVALGFPPALLQGWSQALPGADAIGLAVNRDLTSVRLYVQYWEAIRARAQAGDFSPAPLYVGFKALGPDRLRTDLYTCLPAAPRSRFWPPMAAALAGFGVDATAAEAAFAPLTDATCIYTETQSGERQSWLATVRRAPLDPATLANCLTPLAKRPDLSALAQALSDGDALVHLAGGEDDVKGRFLTLYIESDPETVIAALTRPTDPTP